MKILLKIFLLILLLTTFAHSQNTSRLKKIKEWEKVTYQLKQSKYSSQKLQDRWQQLMEEIIFVSVEDSAESKRIGAKAVRLFSNRMIDRLLDNSDSFGASIYPFTEISNYYFAPLLKYKNKSFIMQRNFTVKENHGLITDIGKLPIEKINEKNEEFIALTNYQPPSKISDIKNEFSANGIIFRQNIPVKIGETYLLRVISYEQGDGIFALKVHRKDTDGSIIIFIKTIKTFAIPKILRPSINDTPAETVMVDEKLVAKVTKALRQKGFKNVQIEIANQRLTISGTVPKGKLPKAVKITQEAAKVPIINHVTEQ
ncbi:MAG TPA: hypothetical protein PKY82_00055 [Pyrinomonadaceae bacterium]|nr:hypothetical protein [Pyrinomonadaceae bacterium]